MNGRVWECGDGLEAATPDPELEESASRQSLVNVHQREIRCPCLFS